MSALYAVAAGGEAGFTAGVALTLAVVLLHQRRHSESVASSNRSGGVSAALPRHLSADVSITRAATASRELSAFADDLAAGDPVLRERLRRIETAATWGGVK